MWTIEESNVAAFRAHLGAKGRGLATIDAYVRDCQSFIEFISQAGIATSDLGPETLDEYQEVLRSKGSKDNSIRRSIIGVRQFFRFLQEHFQWAQSPFDESILPERDDSFTHRLSTTDVENLFLIAKAESSQLKSARDTAMLSVLGLEGIKAGELINLMWKDFFESDSGSRIVIQGPRARTITVESITAENIKSYRDILNNFGHLDLTQPNCRMFVAFRGQDARGLMPEITRHGIKFSLYELGQAAGIKFLNTETLRHFAMAHKIAMGTPPEILMQHLGLRTLGKISRHYFASAPIEIGTSRTGASGDFR